MQIPYILEGQEKLPPEKIKPLRRALVAHEYGHAIFEHNGAKDMRAELKRIREEHLNGPTNDDSPWNRYLYANSQLGALHEIFADTLAVLDSGNLRIMNDSIVHAAPHPEWSRVRDFSIQHKLEDWMEANEHFYFAPVRSYLGSKRIDRSSLEMKKQIVAALLDASKAYMKDTYRKRREFDFFNRFQQQREANARLIEMIEERWPQGAVPTQTRPQPRVIEPSVPIPQKHFSSVPGDRVSIWRVGDTMQTLVFNPQGYVTAGIDTGQFRLEPDGVTLFIDGRELRYRRDEFGRLVSPKGRVFTMEEPVR